MSTQASTINIGLASTNSITWRSKALAILLMLVIGGIFWIDSRYPALLKRYDAGQKVSAKGALTFGTVYAVDRSMPFTTRVYRTTVNWLDANRIGMTFSFLFGPAALTFLAMIKTRRTKSRYVNALIGAVAGTPMAVCTNCATPIARGFYAAGMSTESVLAAMFASPALNVVVLAMTFALFSTKVAILKLATVAFLIFVFSPLMASRKETVGYVCPIDVPASETWGKAIFGVLKSYAKSFWYVFRVAFPFMILGAILGAFAIELLPQNALAAAQVSVGGIILVALVSAFLPVPMAFDVAIAYILYSHGVPLPYAVTILCTLGIISVFSASVLGKTISWRVGVAAYGTVVALGVAAGLISRIF